MVKVALVGGICIGMCAGVVVGYFVLMWYFKDSFR